MQQIKVSFALNESLAVDANQFIRCQWYTRLATKETQEGSIILEV